jgi:hypothetical protein
VRGALAAIGQVVAAVGTFVACALALLLGAGLVEITPGDIPRTTIPVFLLVVVGVPTGAAVWVSRWVRRRWHLAATSSKSARVVWWVVGAAYAITAVFGVPAAVSAQHGWAVQEYKRIRAAGERGVWDAHPYFWTYAAVPVAPGIVLTYHEYQLAGLYGLGTFELTLWYAAGTKSLGTLPLWIS